MQTVKVPYGNKWNRPDQEAERLSISKDLLLDWLHAGVIPGYKISKKVVLFDPEAVDAALRKHFAKKATNE
jgi:excisionase family DNA binding protein